jgi:hypothetical protein
MYQPPHFREDDLGVQHALIRAHPLGLLITAGASGLIANSVPFIWMPMPVRKRDAAPACRQGQSAMARYRGWRRAAGGLPGRRQLCDAVLVRDQARNRQGRADLELCDGAGERAPPASSTMPTGCWRRSRSPASMRLTARKTVGRRRCAGRFHPRPDAGHHRHRNRDRRDRGQVEGQPEPAGCRPRGRGGRSRRTAADQAEMTGLVRRYGGLPTKPEKVQLMRNDT